jgi:DNA repair photolyase
MSETGRPAAKGRGAGFNPANRFEPTHFEHDLEQVEPDDEYLTTLERPRTEFLPDRSRSVIARNDSPDVGFEASLNPYRGCEHGCIYCYARPTHEFLGFSAGLDFETKILVKDDAPARLRDELLSPRWRPQVLSLSGVTDSYQPAERRLRLTRRCLEVMVEFRQAVTIITKNRLVVRDLDLLRQLAVWQAAGVFLSITTLDDDLARQLEPRTSPPSLRLAAIEALAGAGVPVGVMAAPMIPGLTEHELPSILRAAAKAGAHTAGYTILRLPRAVEPLFVDWLDRQAPGSKEKVLSRLRALHAGRLGSAAFGTRMRGEGPLAEMVARIFRATCRQVGLNKAPWPVSPASFQRPALNQPGDSGGNGPQFRQLPLF